MSLWYNFNVLMQTLCNQRNLDAKYDVAYTFSLEHDENETIAANVTAIKVNIADVVPRKINNDGR